MTMQMDAGSLSALFQHTRTWGRAQRGLELFRFAADALSQLAAVNGGLFIYRKRDDGCWSRTSRMMNCARG
ncbi:diguanylate cyclase [Alicyclobacillus acidocaldarius subsp. acidocaldarius Tc-4-1]|uniref:Diguanylate cyclase n=1 Tax=Alicyclobacillus acidocaldarius (strain Tc-4-1) TaxID=1048834 RepID=F8IJ91_ALIAT|nr:diguanylate cyclase [Alicyclobacillus acidocaldarius subsp. acidocaldarius Tc-4-1]